MRYLEAAPDIKNLLEINLTQPTLDQARRIRTMVGLETQFKGGDPNPNYVEENDPEDKNGNYVEPPMTGDGDEIGATFCSIIAVEVHEGEDDKGDVEWRVQGGELLIGGTWMDISADDDPELCWRYIGGRVASGGERLMVLQGFDSRYGEVSYEGNPPLPTALSVPAVNLLAQDYQANVGFGPAEDPDSGFPRVPGATSLRENDWINISRVGGEEINSMDGFTGISQQVIRVTPLSADRFRVSAMANYVHERINNIVGQYPLLGTGLLDAEGNPRTMTLDFQCCLLDEEFDQNDEEANVFGKDQFYLVVVSP